MVVEGTDSDVGALTMKDGLLPQVRSEQVDRDIAQRPNVIVPPAGATFSRSVTRRVTSPSSDPPRSRVASIADGLSLTA
jgi:hypothetical protein